MDGFFILMGWEMVFDAIYGRWANFRQIRGGARVLSFYVGYIVEATDVVKCVNVWVLRFEHGDAQMCRNPDEGMEVTGLQKKKIDVV